MNFKRCPLCGEEIKKGAIKCRYCREWITQPETDSQDEIFDNGTSPDTRYRISTTSYPDGKRDCNRNRIKERTHNNLKCDEAALARAKPTAVPCTEIITQYAYDIPESGWLIRQNFEQGKEISRLLSILSALLLISLAVSLITGKKLSMSPGLLTSTLLVTIIISSHSLLNILNTYLQNFKISRHFVTNAYTVQISLSLSLVAFLFSKSETIATLFAQILQWTGWLFLFISYIALAKTGKYIYNIRNKDYVGGCETLGNIIYKGALFPLIWFAIPLFTYKIFSRAQAYEKKFTKVTFTKKEKEPAIAKSPG